MKRVLEKADAKVTQYKKKIEELTHALEEERWQARHVDQSSIAMVNSDRGGKKMVRFESQIMDEDIDNYPSR